MKKKFLKTNVSKTNVHLLDKKNHICYLPASQNNQITT